VTPAARTVLVTGAAGGLGGAAARLLAERGWTVFAADLTPPAYDGVVPVAMDVTDPGSVDDAVAAVAAQCPDGLGAVVNFAGILRVGALVEIDEAALRQVLEVNLLGTWRVNKAVFALLRAGRGRVVNISSETGWQKALLLNGPYAMSKHAVEAYSDALRRELMFVDLPVVVVQPGPFRTGMTGGIERAFEEAVVPGSPFERLVRRVGRQAAREKGHDSALLAEVVWEAVTATRPRTRYSVRPDPARRVLHHLPDRMADRLLRRALAPRALDRR
jgi:NAD(P)-dependent dehydrogenase (short-subunit alcohol dehydrogenase family)